MGTGKSLVFDWSVLESLAKSIRRGGVPCPVGGFYPIIVVVSEKGETEIPESRKSLWNQLLKSGKIEVKRINPGARSGAMIRERQAEFGDVLFVLGGGTGVEHLVEIYRKAHKPVIPLDLPLGASRADGTGGAERFSAEARADPLAYIRLTATESGKEGAMLTRIATIGGTTPADSVATGVLEILANLAQPTAFYVRLLDQEHAAYEPVERFFRNVVDPVVKEQGMERIDLGWDAVDSGFINVEIFKRLHYSEVAVVDVTGERPNCFIELGYALGRPLRVVCTAMHGTVLPFDQSAIPCHFWKDGISDEVRRKGLRAYWSQYFGRRPLVS